MFDISLNTTVTGFDVELSQASVTGIVYVKIAGIFENCPSLVKIAGVFVEKVAAVKVGGSF
jgi:hypothetical protein